MATIAGKHTHYQNDILGQPSKENVLPVEIYKVPETMTRYSWPIC